MKCYIKSAGRKAPAKARNKGWLGRLFPKRTRPVCKMKSIKKEAEAEQDEVLKMYYRPHDSKLWLTDPKLSKCCPATRGIWSDALDVMWLDGQSGELMGTPVQLSRGLRCSELEMKDAIIELFETGTGDVLLPSEPQAPLKRTELAKLQAIIEANGKLILRNRKMYKAHEISEKNRESGRKGGKKTQSNLKARMSQILKANLQANGKRKSSERSYSDSVSDSYSDSASASASVSVSPGNQDNGQAPGPGNQAGQAPAMDQAEELAGIPSLAELERAEDPF
jgi:hypothetical protein